MRAERLIDYRIMSPDGFIEQVRVWLLPEASQERPHRLKYSLFFGRPGERLVGYDNEQGKGDHRHYRDREESYEFTSLERLLEDFAADRDRERARHGRVQDQGGDG